MSSINQERINQQIEYSMSYQYIERVLSIKDFKNVKAIENVKNFPQQYLICTVEKLLMLTQQKNQIETVFISDRPYLKTDGKLVFLFSDKNSFGKLLSKQDPTLLGVTVIQILKTIYKELYAQNQSPSEDFKSIVEYVIDHETEFSQNLYNNRQIRQILESFPFIIKNNLQIRIRKAVLLKMFYPKLQQKTYYRQMIVNSLNSFNFSIDLKSENCSTLRYLQKFLIVCTKDNILIYPAKRTLDSKSKTDSFESQQHFIVSLITKQVRKSIFNNKFQGLDYFNSKKVSQLTQIMFSFTKISQKNEEYLQLLLQTDFYMSGSSFLYFQQFYQSVLEKYSQIYLEVGFESCFEQNLNNINASVRKKESKLDLSFKLRINRRESIIINFIKTIDLMLIVYLIFEDLLIKYQDEEFLQTLITQQNPVQKRRLSDQMSFNLYQQVKKYLQTLTYFKRNVFYPIYS